MIALAAVGLLVAGCFSNPGNFLWVENETSAEILLRYEASGGDRVFRIGANRNGFVASFPAEPRNHVVLLAPDCTPLGPPMDVPEAGSVVILMPVDGTPVARATAFSPRQVQVFEEIQDCVLR